MNLFDILSAGKRDLNEENISSFLAWILDPKQSHGCGTLFLTNLLELLDKNKFAPLISEISNSSIDILVEEEVIFENKRRFIDLVLVITTKSKEGDRFNWSVIAIENKIRNSAHDKMQLIEEYNGLKDSYKDSNISFLYLTPSITNKFNESFSFLPNEITKSHFIWANSADEKENPSMAKMFRDILTSDDNSQIDPLSNELKFILKSFIVFSENGFRALNSKSEKSGKNAGNKYFKGTLSGIDGIVEHRNDNTDSIYIGFLGGIKALNQEVLVKLQTRSYKWDDNLDNKKKDNWIPVDKFIEIVDGKLQEISA